MEPLDKHQLRPKDQADLVRVGLPSDGGYVVPESAVKRATVLLSLGVKTDWSFDRAFVRLNRGARVIAVDDSVGRSWFAKRAARGVVDAIRYGLSFDRRRLRKSFAAVRNGIDYFVFFSGRHRHLQARVSGRGITSGTSVPALLARSGAATDHRAFVKIDIEGSEYELIADLVACRDAISGIVVEFHDIGRKTDRFNRALAQLLEHFQVVHIHGNNYSAYDDRIQFPECVEITLLNQVLAASPAAASAHEYPRPGLDFPNRPGSADHPLRFE